MSKEQQELPLNQENNPCSELGSLSLEDSIYQIDENFLGDLLDNRANITLSDDKKPSSFYRICLAKQPDLGLITSSIQQGADIHEKYDGHSLLYHLCAQTNPNLNVIECLIKNGADIHEEHDDRSLLYKLCAQPNPSIEVIEYLIKKGVDPNKANKNGVGVLLQLIDPGCVLDSKCYEPLNPCVLQCLIQNGADPYAKDTNREFVFLIQFIKYSDLTCCEKDRKLIEDRFITFIQCSRLDFLKKSRTVYSPCLLNDILLYANDKHYRVIKTLLEMKASSENKIPPEVWGETHLHKNYSPLHYLLLSYVREDRSVLSLISLLIEYGADINLRAKSIGSCLDMVLANVDVNTEIDIELLGHLLSQGASLANFQEYEQSIINRSICNNDITLLLLLIAYGDNIGHYKLLSNADTLTKQLFVFVSNTEDRSPIQLYIRQNLMFYKDISTGFTHFPRTMQLPVISWMLIVHNMKVQKKLPAPPKRLALEMASWMLFTPSEIAENIIKGRIKSVEPVIDKVIPCQTPSPSLLLRFLSHPGIKVVSFLLLLLGAVAFCIGIAAVSPAILGIAASVYTSAGIATASAGGGLLLCGLFPSLVVKCKKDDPVSVKLDGKRNT